MALRNTTDRWRDYTTVAQAIAGTQADPNRSYREDALLARIKQLHEALEAVQAELLLDGYVSEIVETALHG